MPDRTADVLTSFALFERRKANVSMHSARAGSSWNYARSSSGGQQSMTKKHAVGPSLGSASMHTLSWSAEGGELQTSTARRPADIANC